MGHVCETRPVVNNAPRDAVSSTQANSKRTKPKKRDLSNTVLNLLIVAAVIALFAMLVSGSSSGVPRTIAGWSASTVLTGSMADVYPKDSLIVTRQIDPVSLNVGDDVTYMASEDATITHRIIAIDDNYEGANQRVFQTKGTMNSSPDVEPVLAENIVGKVVFCSPELGCLVNWLKTFWAIPLFLLALAIATKALLTRINREPGKTDAREGRQSNGTVRSPKEALPRVSSARAKARDGAGGRKGGAGAAA